MAETKTNFQNQAASIRTLEVQVGQLANMMVDRLPGNLPSTTGVNPVEYYKAITFRSGKELVKPEQNKKPTKKVQQTEITLEPSTKIVEDTVTPQLASSPTIPFPQRLKKNKKDKKLGLGEVRPTTISLQLADRSIEYPRGIIEDILVKVGKFIFPVDFLVLDMEEDENMSIIPRRPFLATRRAKIDIRVRRAETNSSRQVSSPLIFEFGAHYGVSRST
ncbi:uncharacterized protein LOC111019545 [Momordica charantia]|uniref:Uncharacterized protein LOC111019545 n=1 Tax=Momordica charantia TaxID=3673 RepID=A0A6J1DE18_MOMCH|nr:uncharacterized protein LOC111019545 [Momordica charantia]